jgi:capsular exopolysaccharide synthesis family protein
MMAENSKGFSSMNGESDGTDHTPEPGATGHQTQRRSIPQSAVEDEDFDLRGLLLTVWRGKWIIAASAVIAAGLAIFAVSRMEPAYTAYARVLFDPPRANVIEMQDVMSHPDGAGESLQNEIEVLRSTSLLSRVVQEVGFERQVATDEAGETEPGPMSQAGGWVNLRQWVPEDLLQQLGLAAPPSSPAAPEEASRRWLIETVGLLNQNLVVRPIEESRVLELSYTANDPELAARVVNTIAEQYIVVQIEAKLEAAGQATEWLRERIDQLRSRVQEAEESVERTRAELMQAYGESSDVLRQQLNDLNDQLANVRGLRSDLEARHARVASQLNTAGDLGAVADFRESQEIQDLRQRDLDLRNRESQLLTSVEEGHPALERLRDQMSEVREEIRAEAERVSAALRAEIEIVRDRESSLSAQVADLETEIVEQSRLELQLRELEREAQAARAVYEDFLARYNEMTQQIGIQQADARVLSPAEPPLFPDAAQKRSTVIAAGIGGSLLGLGLIFLLERLNNTFRGVRQLETATMLPAIATLPLVKSRDRRDVVHHVRSKPNSSLAEAVRKLRASILLSSDPPKVVMITSAVPVEGKTTTSMLLGLTTVATGHSAIIVDCDLRMPSLASTEKPREPRPGLLSLLEGKASLNDAILVQQGTGLHMLTAESHEFHADKNAADILMSDRFKRLLAKLRSIYDIVILDTPPTLAVTDARILAKSADAVLFAVRWGQTPAGAVIEGLKELRTVDAPVIGTVMTLVDEAKAAKYNQSGYNYSRYYQKYYKNA